MTSRLPPTITTENLRLFMVQPEGVDETDVWIVFDRYGNLARYVVNGRLWKGSRTVYAPSNGIHRNEAKLAIESYYRDRSRTERV